MTWETLQADRVHFGAEQMYLQSEVDKGKIAIIDTDGNPSGDITLIELETAKEEMIADLGKATGYDPETDDGMECIDEVVNNNQRLMKKALAYKQLVMFFRQTEKGPDSREYGKLVLYDNLYETERKGFGNLKLDVVNPGATVQTIQIRM